MQSAPVGRPPAPGVKGASETSTIDLSVVIVNYNVREFLEQAIRSLYQAVGELHVEIFVVDNNSIDGSVEMVRERFPEVQLIANEDNVGFSKANNQAIRIARGRHLLILNPDTIVQEDTLTTLVRFMDTHPKSGAVGCKILNPDGTFAPESRRSFPTPAVAFYRMTGLSKVFPHSQTFGRYNLSYLSPDTATKVDALSGSCMVVRKEAIASAGMFDEDFFMYGEDLDWCYRIQEAGWEIHYTPDTQIIHYKGESTKKGELRYVLLFYGAMLRFAEKHFKKRHSFLFRLFLQLGIVARGSLQAVLNWSKRFSPVLIDAFLIFSTVSLAGVARYTLADMTLPSLLVSVVAPVYTLAAILGIYATGGYRNKPATRILPLISGNLIAMGSLASLSFFIKPIAFSRLTVGASFVLAIVILGSIRLIRSHRQRETHFFRRAILVGNAREAKKLSDTLSTLATPPLEIIGYVAPEPCPPSKNGQLPCLGTFRHLRDLVRLKEISDVVFASKIIPNQTAFDLMQQLKGLHVHFRMLNEHHKHLIGQSSIEGLTSPALVDAEQAIGTTRSTFARRAFEVPLAILGIILYPVVAVVAQISGTASWAGILTKKLRQFPAILVGKRALIGYRHDEKDLVSPMWNLKPGIFAVSESLPGETQQPNLISQAYWLYVRNQSITFDIDILLRALRQQSKKGI